MEDINNIRSALEKDIDKEINAAEEEINNLKINSNEKIKNIAVETLVQRVKNLRLTPGKNDLKHQPGIMLGLYELHLSFDKVY